MGLRSGVSDLHFLKDGRFYVIELKREGGRPTEQQLKFLQDIRDAGGFAVLCEGLDAALRCLETWGLLRGQST